LDSRFNQKFGAKIDQKARVSLDSHFNENVGFKSDQKLRFQKMQVKVLLVVFCWLLSHFLCFGTGAPRKEARTTFAGWNTSNLQQVHLKAFEHADGDGIAFLTRRLVMQTSAAPQGTGDRRLNRCWNRSSFIPHCITNLLLISRERICAEAERRNFDVEHKSA
jgi:hypothetical protein